MFDRIDKKIIWKKSAHTSALFWHNIEQPDILKDLDFLLYITLKCTGLLKSQEHKQEQYREAELGHRYWLSSTVQLNQWR